MTLRAVFFDVFGTLMPYKRLPREVILSRRAARIGLSVPPERIAAGLAEMARRQASFGMGTQLAQEDVPRNRTYWEGVFARVLQASGVTGDVAAYGRAMYDAFLSAEDYYLDEEAVPTLRGLRQRGLIVGVISNAPAGLAEALEKFGLLTELDLVVSSNDVGLEKPDPAIFHYALDKANKQPHEAAYVGDEYSTDIVGARNAGMLGILLDRDGQRKTADVPIIRRLSELLAPHSPLGSGGT